jgi:hypothetical protein
MPGPMIPGLLCPWPKAGARKNNSNKNSRANRSGSSLKNLSEII